MAGFSTSTKTQTSSADTIVSGGITFGNSQFWASQADAAPASPSTNAVLIGGAALVVAVLLFALRK